MITNLSTNLAQRRAISLTCPIMITLSHDHYVLQNKPTTTHLVSR